MSALRAISTADDLIERESPCRLVPSDGPLVEPSDEEIRLRSQEIWEREGCPEGHADDHWARAKAELAEQMAKMANRPQDDQPDVEPFATPVPEQTDAKVEDAIPARLEDIVPAALEIAVPATTEDTVAAALEIIPRKHTARFPRSQQTSVVPSIICAGLVLRGVLESPGDLQFDGCMEGEVHSTVLHVGEDAVIEGEVTADDLTVRGSIRGTIRAQRVLLCTGCHIEGDIWYGALIVESGAQPDATFHPLEHSPQEVHA